MLRARIMSVRIMAKKPEKTRIANCKCFDRDSSKKTGPETGLGLGRIGASVNKIRVVAKLKGETSSKLEDAVRATEICGVRNLACVGVGRGYVRVRQAEIWMVENVIGIGSKFEIHAFSDAEGFAEA